MRIYPAIDIIDGKCVRLTRGDYGQKTVFDDDPCEVALKWQSMGAEFVHLVDLDGAKLGNTPNFELITRIARTLDVPVQIGGGVRNINVVRRYLNAGVQRVIIGTAAVREPEFVKLSVDEYGERIAVGIDAKNGYVAVSGWQEVCAVTAVELAKSMQTLGVQYIIYTDIETDGMLQGPNISAMKEMSESVSVNVIASGGVSEIKDVTALKQTNVEGVIIGKALYTGAVGLPDAIKEGKN